MGIYGPRQTVLVTCRGKAKVLGREQEKDNIITVAWHMPLSVEPPMYAVAIGKPRFSAKLITASKVFCVNFIPKSMQEAALYCGRNSGEHVDKFSQAGLELEECEKIDCPRIAGCLGHLECEVVEQVEAGDHIIFIAKVAHSQQQKEDKRLFHMGGDRFTTTEKE